MYSHHEDFLKERAARRPPSVARKPGGRCRGPCCVSGLVPHALQVLLISQVLQVLLVVAVLVPGKRES